MTRPGRLLLPALAAVALLAHLPAVLPTRSYFFRDFGMAFYPFHRFWAEELREGRWPAWNPFIQSGVAAFPMVYPVDFLHVLWPSPEGVSWLLTLHYPLAALAAFALARELGIARGGAFVCGSVFALGGLAVAALNLYVFLQALAWAPLVAALLLRAATRGGRWVPLASAVLGVALTTAQEFTLQAVALGGLLALVDPLPRRGPALLRLALAIVLGLGLAAVPIAVVAGVLPETLRGRGLDPSRILEYEIHPAVLLQVLVRDFAGSVTDPLEIWWGHRFFTKGFPYFVTLYLGPQVLALAAAGMGALPRRRRLLLVGLGAAAVAYALGRFVGLSPLLAALPGFSAIRFPSKAFLLVHLVLAVLAGAGAERLSRGEGWRAYRVAAAVLTALALALAMVVHFSVDLVADWMWSDPGGNAILRAVLRRDALVTAAVGGLGLLVALGVAAGRLAAPRAALLAAVVTVLDLARAGAGVNPQTTPAFYEPLPELAAERLDHLDGGRVFTYGTEHSPAFHAFVRSRPAGGLLWAYFVRRQMLVPHVNVGDRVEGAFADDEGAFVFLAPDVAGPVGYDPQRFGAILPALREVAVTRVLSLDPLAHPDLRLRAAVPTGAPGLAVHVYALGDSRPRAHVACRVRVLPSRADALAAARAPGFDGSRDVALEQAGTASCATGAARLLATVPGEDVYEVEADGPGYLVTRDSHARGWQSTVDGRPAPVLRANGRWRAVALTSGRHVVRFRYEPPGLRAGLVVMALAAVAAAGLLLRPVLRADDVRG